MLTLYGGTRTRAVMVAWYLEELQVPYEFVCLDMAQGAHRQADYLQINPLGKVPALVDEGTVVWESGAILLYLADKFGQMPTDVGQRGQIYQWVLFSNATLVQESEMGKLLPPLQQILGNREYISGDKFTVADVALGGILELAVQLFGLDLSPYSQIGAYVQRCGERGAFQKAMVS